MASAPLRVGYVPEHFSTPIHFASKHFGLDAQLVPFPSGTGHMITALRSNEIDVGIGLTEGWVAGLGKEDVQGDGGYRLVGTYVETPLCTSSNSTCTAFSLSPRGRNAHPCDDQLADTTGAQQAGRYPQEQHGPRSRASIPSMAARLASPAWAPAPT